MRQCSKLLVLATVCSAAAAASGGDATNREIVVTATRIEKKADEIPASVTVLTSDEIRAAGHASVVDALKSVSGVQVRSTSGNDAAAEVAMRGFGENAHGRVLVLLDGRRLNRPDMAGINWLQVPIASVSRIEVIRGGGSSLYGDNAVAGVINIVTAGDEGPGLSLEGTAGSHGQRSVRAGASGGGGEGATYSANAEHYELEGYRARSAFRSQGGGARVAWDLPEASRLSLSLSAQGVQSEMPGPLTAEQMHADRRQSLNPADSAEDRYFNADIGYDSEPSSNQRVSLHAVFGRKDIATDMTSWGSFNDLVSDTAGIQPRYQLRGSLFGVRHDLTLGVDAYRDTLDVDRFGDRDRTAALMSADVTRRTLGGYAREEVALPGDWRVGIGGRLEYCRLEADVLSADRTTDIDESKTSRVSAGELSVVRGLAGCGRLFARAATVYRLPFVDEQVSYYGFGSDVFYPDIEPETGWTVEAGWDVRATNMAASLTLFRLNMRDEIAYDNAAFRNRNMDDTRHDGAELALGVRADSWCWVEGRYTLNRAVFTGGQYSGSDIPLTPRHQASVCMSAKLPAAVTVDTTVSYVGRAFLAGDYANSGVRLASYTTVDVMARYSPKHCDGLELSVGVNNLFDQEYSSLGYLGWDGVPNYYPSPERTFKVGASWRY